jgi:hypothetical protein
VNRIALCDPFADHIGPVEKEIDVQPLVSHWAVDAYESEVPLCVEE